MAARRQVVAAAAGAARAVARAEAAAEAAERAARAERVEPNIREVRFGV